MPIMESDALVNTCFLNGHNNMIVGAVNSQGAPASGADVETLIVVGHNNRIDNVRV
jgi:hypothetical protein